MQNQVKTVAHLNATSPASLRVRLMQFESRPGCPELNTERMLTHLAQARVDGIELLVFPELAVPGYLLGDEWERSAFLRRDYKGHSFYIKSAPEHHRFLVIHRKIGAMN